MQCCNFANTSRQFENGRPEDLIWIDAVKLVCAIDNHRGFSTGGDNIYFIPGAIMEESCESQLEDEDDNGKRMGLMTCSKQGQAQEEDLLSSSYSSRFCQQEFVL